MVASHTQRPVARWVAWTARLPSPGTILAIVLVIRLAFLIGFHVHSHLVGEDGFNASPYGGNDDGRYYYATARQLADGEVPPYILNAFPRVLAVLMMLGIRDLLALKLISYCVSSVAIVLAFVLTHHLTRGCTELGRRTALACVGAVGCLFPSSVFWSMNSLVRDGWILTFIMIVLWAASTAPPHPPRLLRWGLGLAALGAAGAFRPYTIPIALAAVVSSQLRFLNPMRGVRPRALPALWRLYVIALGFILFCLAVAPAIEAATGFNILGWRDRPELLNKGSSLGYSFQDSSVQETVLRYLISVVSNAVGPFPSQIVKPNQLVALVEVPFFIAIIAATLRARWEDQLARLCGLFALYWLLLLGLWNDVLGNAGRNRIIAWPVLAVAAAAAVGQRRSDIERAADPCEAGTDAEDGQAPPLSADPVPDELADVGEPRVPRLSPARLLRVPWPGVANLLNAAGNTLSVFAISVASSNASAFSVYAAGLGAMMLAFGISHAILGETMSIQRRFDVAPTAFLGAAAMVAAALSSIAALVLALSPTTRHLALLSLVAVFGLLVNDALRHWAFRARRGGMVATSDAAWLAISAGLYLAARDGLLGPGAVYFWWSATGLLLAGPLLALRQHDGADRTRHALRWLRESAPVGLRLGAEAAAATAALTLPLTMASLFALSDEGGAVRLLQAVFGFQQIAFFSALVSIGGRDESERLANRAGAVLAGAGALMSVTVGAALWIAPNRLLTSLLGEAATVASDTVWSFVFYQCVASMASGALLALRLSGRATSATTPRVLAALGSTVLATALMPLGVPGFAAGSASGSLVFTLLVLPELDGRRRTPAQRSRQRNPWLRRSGVSTAASGRRSRNRTPSLSPIVVRTSGHGHA